MKSKYALNIGGILIAASALLSANPPMEGDFEIVASNGGDGNLSIEGSLTVLGMINPASTLETAALYAKEGVDFGTKSVGGGAGVFLSYFDDNVSAVSDISKDDGQFFWRDSVDGVGAPENKMLLDPDNKFTLFKRAGGEGISLDPNNGQVTLTGLNSGIYHSSGGTSVPVLKVGSGGNAVFSGGVTFEQGIQFPGGANLNPDNMAYLEDLLKNFGYRENAAEPTSMTNFYIGGGLGSVKMASYGDFLYFATSSSGGSLSSTTDTSFGNTTLPRKPGIHVVLAESTGQTYPLFSLLMEESIWGLNSAAPLSMTVGPSGEVFVLAELNGNTANLGLGYEIENATYGELYLFKIASWGTLEWVRKISAYASSPDGPMMAVAADGSVVVAGSTSGSDVSVEGLPGAVTGAGSYDGFLVKFASDGTAEFAKIIGGSADDVIADVAVDASGNITAVGRFTVATTTLGAGHELSATGSEGMVVRWNASGAVAWSKAGGPSTDFTSIALDAAGNPIVGGWFLGDLAGLGAPALVSEGDYDGVVAKLSSASGALVWARPIGGESMDYAGRVAINSSGEITVAGFIYSPATTNLGAGYEIVKSTGWLGNTPYLLKLDSLGAPLESEGFGSVVPLGNSPINPWPVSNLDLTLVGTKTFIYGTSTERVRIGNTQTRANSSGWSLYGSPFILGWEGTKVVTSPITEPAPMSWGGGLASGQGGVALGRLAVASGTHSTAFGSGWSSGENSFSSGTGVASGAQSSAFGSNAIAAGSYAFATGIDTEASGYGSAAFGKGTRAAGVSSFAIGEYNIGGETAEWFLGGFGIDPIFEIGNGMSGWPSNAVTTLRNGRTTLSNRGWKGIYTSGVPEDPLHIPESPDDSGGEALIVEGHTRLKGRVVIEQPQGDISMGVYGGN